MIIKEIPHKSAKARAKAENRQQVRALTNVAKSIGGMAVKTLSNNTQIEKMIENMTKVDSNGRPNQSSSQRDLNKQNAQGAKNLNNVMKALSGSTHGTSARGVKAPQPRSVKATIEYALKGDNETQGELIYSQKLEMIEPEMIVIAMDTTAAMNQEVKNPCKHFVISWDEGEKPTRSQMTRSIATYLKHAGYEEHQAVAYLHTDTEKTHIHIIANHVHPETFKAVHRDFLRAKQNHKIRERVARQLEVENGWKQVEGKLLKLDNDGNLVERTYEEKILFSLSRSDKISDKSRRQEVHSGVPSFERWCKESKESDHLRKDIKKIITGKKTDWNDIHKILDKYNIEIKPDKYRKGLVVYDRREPDKRCIAASGLSRDLSAGNLGKIINTPYMPFVRSTERPSEALPPVKETILPTQQPVLPESQSLKVKGVDSPAPALTAYPSQIAIQYETWANQINSADPARAKTLKDAAVVLKKQTNVREITFPHPSAPVADVTAAMQGMGGRNR